MDEKVVKGGKSIERCNLIWRREQSGWIGSDNKLRQSLTGGYNIDSGRIGRR